MLLKKIVTVVIITLIIATITPKDASAYEKWNLWNAKTTDNPLKDWTIELSQNPDPATVNGQSVYITDSNGIKMQSNLSVEGGNINISPHAPYVEGHTYYLYITEELKSKGGKKAASGIKMPFSYQKASDEIVKFPDPGFEDLIREELGKPEGAIYKGELLSIESLSRGSACTSSPIRISSLEGIQNIKNLKSLYLVDHHLVDLSPLKGLTKLERLTVSKADFIRDIECLGNLINLKQLNLEKNMIEDISPLSKMTHLEEVILSNNLISDISCFEAMSNLQKLQLANNNISVIESLRNMKNLKWLWLGENPIEDYSPVVSYYDVLEYIDFEPKVIIEDLAAKPMYTQQIDEKLPEIIDIVGATIKVDDGKFDIKLNVRNIPDKIQVNSPYLGEDDDEYLYDEYMWQATVSDGNRKCRAEIVYTKGDHNQDILYKKEFPDAFYSYVAEVNETEGNVSSFSHIGPMEMHFNSYDNSVQMKGSLPEGFGTIASVEIDTFYDDGIDYFKDSMKVD